MPPELGRLTRVNRLSLHNNELAALADEVGDMCSLQWLCAPGPSVTMRWRAQMPLAQGASPWPGVAVQCAVRCSAGAAHFELLCKHPLAYDTQLQQALRAGIYHQALL